MAGVFLSLRRVLPDRYPLELDVERYIAREPRLARMLDYAYPPRPPQWSAEDLGQPRLRDLVRDGNLSTPGRSSSGRCGARRARRPWPGRSST